MGKSNFDKLMQRYLVDQVSEEERIKIEAWMDVRKTEDTGDLELSKEDAEKMYQRIISRNSSESEIRQLASRDKSRTLWWTYRIAAGLLIVVLVGYFGWKQGVHDGSVTEVASSGSTEKVILKDGSLVWLKGESNLTYQSNYAEGIRYAELKGEALFEVAKDAAHPFVIQCGKVQLKVLGTSFSIRSTGDNLELRVLTGKVKVSTSGDTTGIVALPGAKVIYETGGNLSKFTLTQTEIEQVTSGTEYAMNFKDATLGVVLENLQRKFDVDFNVKESNAKDCHLTVDLTDRSLESSLQLISDVLDIDYTIEKKNVTVSGKGCP